MLKPLQLTLDAWLLRPFVDLSQIERRNAYLITALSFVAVFAVGIRTFLFTPSPMFYGVFALVFIAYLLSRYGRRQAASILILGLLSVPSLMSLYTTPVLSNFDPTNRILWLIFPLILGSVFLSLRGLMVYAILCGAVIIAAPLFHDTMDFGSAGIALGFFGISAALLVVVLTHRNYIEQLRQQELQDANQKLRESEQILEKRVIERTEELNLAKIDAEKAKLSAENANQVKSQFLANMSHELRTPLNAILNFTAFVADGIMGPVNDEQVSTLQEAIASGKHLLALINDILDITKIEAGLMDLFIQEVDMNELISSSASIGKGLVKDKPIDLIVELEDNLPKSYGDKRRLRQIFLNMVSNAVKFTKAGHVAVRAKMHEGKLHVEVEDTGIGIAAQDYDLVFQSFKQAKHELTETIGTGLGMPISKYFVESHGGKIWLQSTVGKGTTFFVELPILSEAEANTIALKVTA
jgi:signal transduction histidine kinase